MANTSERNQLSSAQRLLLALDEAAAKLEAVERAKTEPIAITGMSCRFPGGADNPEAFWQLLRNGVDGVTEVPSSRWKVDDYYDPNPDTPGKIYTRSGGFLQQVDQFEPQFFGLTPREAVSLDPQQRLLLEVSWEALENAGVAPNKLAGSKTGIFVGIGQNDYAQLQLNSGDPADISAYDGTGNGFCFASGRLSYVLGLQGPNIAVDTACSSSLVSVHLACQSLRAGECKLALAGGVHLILSPEVTIFLSRARALSPDGRCKTFDAAADGYGRGEGCGILVLKRLSDAIADGDNILALVRGSAVNHGGKSSGITVPNKLAQQEVIRQALSNAKVEPSQVSYIEAHGTGTSLGDPIEVRALGAVLGEGRSPDQPLMLGSVKTNIGHLEAAAGVAGLIKVILALQHQEIPPHLHFNQPNPYIDWNEFPLAIPTEKTPWNPDSKQRIAGVSSFSISGTNAHILLEEAPSDSRKPLNNTDQNPKSSERPLHLLTLSARTQESLKQLAAQYDAYITSNPTSSLGDICFTANTGRSHFNHRISLLAASSNELSKKLAAFTTGQEAVGVFQGHVEGTTQPKVAFLFTGQGSQYVDMGRQLYEQAPIFRACIDRCDEILRPYLEKPLLSVLYPQQAEVRSQEAEVRSQKSEVRSQKSEVRSQEAEGASAERGFPDISKLKVRSQNGDHSPDSWILDSDSYINQTAYAQPALFALEYALCKLWLSWGITPDVVMGHSVGEYVAACIAGVFSLEDGLKLIATRASLMQALPPDGEMVAVFASLSQVQAAIQDVAAKMPNLQKVAIAAINGPQNIVISGERECIAAVKAALAVAEVEGTPDVKSGACNENFVKTKKLQVSHAFHSPLMAPMLREFEQVAASVTYSQPKIKLISNLTGSLATKDIATAGYWCRHIMQPVQFAASMETLHQQKYEVFVEIGPKPTMLEMGRYCLPDKEAQWLPSLRPKQEDWQQLLQSLAKLYTSGVSIDWSGFDRGYPRRKVLLPTYPFQRQRYWVENARNGQKKTGKLSSEKAWTPLFDLLHEGDTKKLAAQLEIAGKLEDSEVKLLPRLLEILVKQHHQQLSAASLQDLYQIEWQPKSRQLQTAMEPIQASQPGSWLIFADKGGVGQALAALLQQQGNNCVLVYADQVYRAEGVVSLDPAAPGDFEHLVQEVMTRELPLRGVIHLWSLEAGASPELTISALEQAQALGVGSVVHLLQALIKHQNPTPPAPQLWLVTRGAVPAASSLPNVAQSPLWGLGKVVALEQPEIWGGMIDLAPDATSSDLTMLMAEILDSQGEDHLAFRSGQRYVARLVRSQPQELQEVPLRSDSTYLITGGTGALGFKMAQWMVDRGVKHLVLTGRREASAEVRSSVTQMERLGIKVLVAQADVSSQEDMARVLEEVKGSMPPLRGVIHAAGVPGYQAIADMELNTLDCVLRPKVLGAWILHQLTQEMKLDFFVGFSSIASVWGSKGQAHYAAANHFIDSLAYYRRGLGLPALSVNWGPWAGGGMTTAEAQTWLTRMGVEGLQQSHAIATLEYLLQVDCTQVTVASVDWTLFKKLYEARKPRPLLEAIEVQHQEIQSAQRSDILQRLEDAPAKDRYLLLTTHLQNEIAKVLGLDSSQLEPKQSLFDIGMDSLMAVELLNLIRTQLQVDLSVAEFLAVPNIAMLAALLLKQLTPDDATPDVAVDVLNLNDEAVLDEEIYPSGVKAEQTETSSILLTGGTGFLGAFLLKELLEQTLGDIYCLVRAVDAESGMQRIQKNLESYSLWNKNYSSRIIPVLGDLSQPRLGLSAEQFERMSCLIDVIYHNGAFLNFVYPYSALKPINVLGTQEILRLACQSKVKPLHYVSSDNVYDSSGYYGKVVTESEPIIHTEGMDLGYTQSKWASEKLVTIARERGLPVSIYRPPLIAGDSRTGVWNTDDFICRLIKGCIQMGSIPQMNSDITFVPVDYVSQAIVYLSKHKEHLGKAFHLNHPNASSWSEVSQRIHALGYPLRQISYQSWEAELTQIVSTGADNALSGLLPFFLRRWSEKQLNFAELAQNRPKLSCQETVASLAGSSIVCALVDSKLLNTYFAYLIRSGFLDAPQSNNETESYYSCPVLLH